MNTLHKLEIFFKVYTGGYVHQEGETAEDVRKAVKEADGILFWRIGAPLTTLAWYIYMTMYYA